MGRYPEAEDRDSTVVDLESYRRRREIARRDADAEQEPHAGGSDGTGTHNAPAESNRKD